MTMAKVPASEARWLSGDHVVAPWLRRRPRRPRPFRTFVAGEITAVKDEERGMCAPRQRPMAYTSPRLFCPQRLNDKAPLFQNLRALYGMVTGGSYEAKPRGRNAGMVLSQDDIDMAMLMEALRMLSHAEMSSMTGQAFLQNLESAR